MAGRGWKVIPALFMLGLGFTACSSTPANDFEAGECTNEDLSGSVGEIDTVDCDDQHTAEAYAQFDLDDSDDFPGADQVSQQATEGCQGDRFEEYVGLPYNESKFVAQSVNPTEETWDNGDRTVICVINGTTDGSSLEGSAEGTEE
jgi:Septum formation